MSHSPDAAVNPPLRVMFFCTGTGLYFRGVESLFRETFDGLELRLRPMGIDIRFFAGGANPGPYEQRVFCLPRTTLLARFLAKLINRPPYVVEQLTFIPGLIRAIRKQKPEVILYADGNVATRLWNWRDKIGVPYKMIFNNGAPAHPPFRDVDHVQQVAPFYYDEAIQYGEPAEKHTLLPQGFFIPDGDPVTDTAAKNLLREKLDLPKDRTIVISVGAIGMKTHKRMPYTVSELARIPADKRPFLLLLGAIEEGTDELRAIMERDLGTDNFAIRSVPFEQVRPYYQASDVFVLGSLVEGFGRVYVEALIEGLPSIVHDSPVMRYVLGDEGIFADLNTPGSMADALMTLLSQPLSAADAVHRREAMRARYSWDVLAPQYADMFLKVARGKSLQPAAAGV